MPLSSRRSQSTMRLLNKARTPVSPINSRSILLGRLQAIASELEAIQYWDADYVRRKEGDTYDATTFAFRQKRWRELIAELRSVLGQH